MKRVRKSRMRLRATTMRMEIRSKEPMKKGRPNTVKKDRMDSNSMVMRRIMETKMANRRSMGMKDKNTVKNKIMVNNND